LMTAVACEESYYKWKDERKDIDFSVLAKHAFCFSLTAARFARLRCKPGRVLV
jgi:hypothetical protein